MGADTHDPYYFDKKTKLRWVSVKERLPNWGKRYLKCIFGNGNICHAIGYYDHNAKEWVIEYSGDFPDVDDIKYWLEEIQ